MDAHYIVVGGLMLLISPRNTEVDAVAGLGATAGPTEAPGDSIQQLVTRLASSLAPSFYERLATIDECSAVSVHCT